MTQLEVLGAAGERRWEATGTEEVGAPVGGGGAPPGWEMEGDAPVGGGEGLLGWEVEGGAAGVGGGGSRRRNREGRAGGIGRGAPAGSGAGRAGQSSGR